MTRQKQETIYLLAGGTMLAIYLGAAVALLTF